MSPLEVEEEVLRDPDIAREPVEGGQYHCRDLAMAAITQEPAQGVFVEAIDEEALPFGEQGYIANLDIDAEAPTLLFKRRDAAVGGDCTFALHR